MRVPICFYVRMLNRGAKMKNCFVGRSYYSPTVCNGANRCSYTTAANNTGHTMHAGDIASWAKYRSQSCQTNTITEIAACKFDEFHAQRCSDGPNCGWMEATMLLTVDDHIFNTLCRSNGLGTGKMLPAEIRDTKDTMFGMGNEKIRNHWHCWHGCCGS